jgi:hypothetical protein
MSKLTQLRQIIREVVESELDEMARISTNIKIGDVAKAAAAKRAYEDTWIEDLIIYVEDSGDAGIPQPELAKKLGKSGMQAINPKVREFLEAGILTKGELSMAKKEKVPTSGTLGRPTSEKTMIARELDAKFQENPDYRPSADELEALGFEYIEKLRLRAKGLLKRGRPAKPSSRLASTPAPDEDMDGMDDTLLQEIFFRMQNSTK